MSTLWEEYTEMCIPLQNLECIRSKELGVHMCVCERERENTERDKVGLNIPLSV